MIIEVTEDAAESYSKLLQCLQGYGVEVTTYDGAVFDCKIDCVDWAADWYGSIVVLPYDFATDEVAGELRSVVAEKVKVY